MSEQFADFSANTTVGASGYTSGSGTINVASTGGSFPASPTFSIVILNQTTFAPIVVLRVSAVTDSTHWAVTASGTDASASSGDFVYYVFNKDTITQLRKDVSGYGAYASRPATGAEGDIYICNDGPVKFYYNGSTWVPRYATTKQLTFPVLANMVAIGTPTATATDTGMGITITGSANTGSTYRTNSNITTPTTMTCCMQGVIQNQDYVAHGMVAFDNTGGANQGKFMTFHIEHSSSSVRLVVNRINANGSYNSTILNKLVYAAGSISTAHPTWFRVRDTGTTRYYEISGNGYDWSFAFSEATGTFCTPNLTGFFGQGSSSYVPCSRLLHLDIQPT